MLRLYTLIIILVLTSLYTLLHFNSALGVWNIPSSSTHDDDIFSTHETKFLKIDYPVTWIVNEDTNNLITFSPTVNSIDKITVSVTQIKDPSIPFQSIVDSTLDELVNTLNEFELREIGSIQNLENNSKLVFSYYDDNENKIQQLDVGMKRDNKLFVISLISNYTNYYKYLSTFETMLTSFNFYNQQNILNQYSSQLLQPVANFVPPLGKSASNVTIVEFGDYQCTFCEKFHKETRDSIINNFINNGKIAFLFKDYIVNDDETDKSSTNAAMASYCAGEQGKYWDYHNELYNNWAGEKTGWITINSLKKFATNIGVPNISEFSECISSQKYNDLVQTNDNLAKSLGLSGTPAFLFVKGGSIQTIIPGALPYNVFEQILNTLTSDES